MTRALLSLAAFAGVILSTPALSQIAPPAGGTPIIIGQSYTLESKILSDTRRLNVWLPPSYGHSGLTYPVLVLLDGGAQEDFQHIVGLAQITSAYGHGREFIVVGIEGVDRRHDLSPTTEDSFDLRFTKTPGGAEKYRRFLAEEVKPWVAAHYRINGRSAIIGESMAGLFILDTLRATPDAFNDYISISPIVWWNRQAVSRALAATPPATGPDRRLFIAFEGSMNTPPTGPTHAQQAEVRLETALRNRPDVTTVRFAEERHDTIYHPAALAAFRSLYAIEPPTRPAS